MFKSKEKRMKEYWDKLSPNEIEKEMLWYQYKTSENTKKISFYVNVIGIIILLIVIFNTYKIFAS